MACRGASFMAYRDGGHGTCHGILPWAAIASATATSHGHNHHTCRGGGMANFSPRQYTMARVMAPVTVAGCMVTTVVCATRTTKKCASVQVLCPEGREGERKVSSGGRTIVLTDTDTTRGRAGKDESGTVRKRKRRHIVVRTRVDSAPSAAAAEKRRGGRATTCQEGALRPPFLIFHFSC